MTNVVIRPCASRDARRHYEDTIANPVDLAANRALIHRQDYERLEGIFAGVGVPMWGVVPGLDDKNVEKYHRAGVGDVALFTGQGRVLASGVIAYKFRNAQLAEHPWGRDESQSTWECMYALTNVREQDIPYQALNEASGDSPANNHMGFRVMHPTSHGPDEEPVGTGRFRLLPGDAAES